jgi:hypothetical protein
MTKTRTVRLLVFGALGAVISCDGATMRPSSGGLAAGDCPFGTFRPAGLEQCVFPAQDINNNSVTVTDNRCALGQPASPPSCVSDAGLRAYLALGPSCAPGYRFEDGSCNRNTGAAGSFPTGGGTGVAGSFGDAGFSGETGGFFGDAGSGGVFNPCGDVGGCGGVPTGIAGSFGDAGTNGAAGFNTGGAGAGGVGGFNTGGAGAGGMSGANGGAGGMSGAPTDGGDAS